MEQVDVCTSWEEFDDNKLLEEQLKKLKIQKERTSTVNDPTEHQSSSNFNVPEETPKMRILKRAEAAATINNSETTNGATASSTNGVVIEEDSLRTQYVPPEPRISILTRPKNKTSEETSTSSSNQTKGKNQPLKTLEQREQEYAEARRRIFGDTVET